jgi:hypothetical protein
MHPHFSVGKPTEWDYHFASDYRIPEKVQNITYSLGRDPKQYKGVEFLRYRNVSLCHIA